jgi:uncharacterized membrane protein YbhN (UPF0104 family)
MTDADKSPGRFGNGWALRLSVSIVVLGVIFYFLPFRDVLATMRKVAIGDWLVTLAVFLIGHVVCAAKWQLLANSGAGFLTVLRAHFGGLVANLSLPGVAGGDVVRAALLYRHVSDKARLAMGSVADRFIDTVGLLLIAGAGLLLAIGQFEPGVNLLVWVGGALVVFAVGAVMAVKFHPHALRLLPASGKLAWIGKRVGESIVTLSRQPGRLMLCLALSIAVQIAFIAANVRLAEAAGVHAPIAAWFFAWPLAKLIATLPISIAGLGVREASLAGFLAPFGAAPAAVVAIGLIWQTIQVSGGLIGGLILLLSARAIAGARIKVGGG